MAIVASNEGLANHAVLNTVRGAIAPYQLGVTLVHEHVVTGFAGMWQTYPELLGDLDRVTEASVASITEARAANVRTIVDLTTFDLGRNVRFLSELSRRTGMQIVVATGVWRNMPFGMESRDPDEIASLFVREIMQGIDGTYIRAGVIKVASDSEGVTPAAEVVLRAAARAARHTGTAVYTHSYAPGRVGDRQLAILLAEGLDPDRICIGHSNDSEDLEYLRGLLAHGCYLGMDRYLGRVAGVPSVGPDWERRTEILARLFDTGASSRLLVSHDWSPVLGHRTSDLSRPRAMNPEGWGFIHRTVLPRLHELGAPANADVVLLEENPRRFLFGTR